MHHLRTAFLYLRLQPFDTTSVNGRTAERYRIALWSMITELASRLAGVIVMVMSVSWTLPYLGQERFGAWMTIASLAAVLGFLDLGIANALTNRVTNALHSGAITPVKQAVTGGLSLLALVSTCLAALLIWGATKWPWQTFLGLKSPNITAEISTAAQIFVCLFALTLLSTGIARVFHGLQRAYEVHIANTVGSITALTALYFATQYHANISILLMCQMGGPILTSFVLGGLLYKRGIFDFSEIRTSLKIETFDLIKVGRLFFLLQLGTTVGWNADNLILASVSGAASVAAFSVTQRLFQFVSQPLSILNAPLWAAYADANAAHDREFIRKTFARSIATTFIAGAVGAAACILFGPKIIDTWTTGAVTTNHALIISLAIWMILESSGNALAMLLNGLGIIRQQVWTAGAFILLAIPSKIIMTQAFGASGTVWASIISYATVIAVCYGIIYRNDIFSKIR